MSSSSIANSSDAYEREIMARRSNQCAESLKCPNSRYCTQSGVDRVGPAVSERGTDGCERLQTPTGFPQTSKSLMVEKERETSGELHHCRCTNLKQASSLKQPFSRTKPHFVTKTVSSRFGTHSVLSIAFLMFLLPTLTIATNSSLKQATPTSSNSFYNKISQWSTVAIDRVETHSQTSSSDLNLPDKTAKVGRLFRYQMPLENVTKYEAREAGRPSLPLWLHLNQSSGTFTGVPLTTDAGQVYIIVDMQSKAGETHHSTTRNTIFTLTVEKDCSYSARDEPACNRALRQEATSSNSDTGHSRLSTPDACIGRHSPKFNLPWHCDTNQSTIVANLIFLANFKSMDGLQRANLLRAVAERIGICSALLSVRDTDWWESEGTMIWTKVFQSDTSYYLELPLTVLAFPVACGSPDYHAEVVLAGLDGLPMDTDGSMAVTGISGNEYSLTFDQWFLSKDGLVVSKSGARSTIESRHRARRQVEEFVVVTANPVVSSTPITQTGSQSSTESSETPTAIPSMSPESSLVPPTRVIPSSETSRIFITQSPTPSLGPSSGTTSTVQTSIEFIANTATVVPSFMPSAIDRTSIIMSESPTRSFSVRSSIEVVSSSATSSVESITSSLPASTSALTSMQSVLISMSPSVSDSMLTPTASFSSFDTSTLPTASQPLETTIIIFPSESPLLSTSPPLEPSSSQSVTSATSFETTQVLSTEFSPSLTPSLPSSLFTGFSSRTFPSPSFTSTVFSSTQLPSSSLSFFVSPSFTFPESTASTFLFPSTASTFLFSPTASTSLLPSLSSKVVTKLMPMSSEELTLSVSIFTPSPISIPLSTFVFETTVLFSSLPTFTLSSVPTTTPMLFESTQMILSSFTLSSVSTATLMPSEFTQVILSPSFTSFILFSSSSVPIQVKSSTTPRLTLTASTVTPTPTQTVSTPLFSSSTISPSESPLLSTSPTLVPPSTQLVTSTTSFSPSITPSPTPVSICDFVNCSNGVCIDRDFQFECNCFVGWTGEFCTTDIDFCDPFPCLENNTLSCSDGNSTYVCNCAQGYAGPNCTIDTDPCEPNPCQNGGTCIVDLQSAVGGIGCECPEDTDGSFCEFLSNPCVSDPCEPGEVCVDLGRLGYVCSPTLSVPTVTTLPSPTPTLPSITSTQLPSSSSSVTSPSLTSSSSVASPSPTSSSSVTSPSPTSSSSVTSPSFTSSSSVTSPSPTSSSSITSPSPTSSSSVTSPSLTSSSSVTSPSFTSSSSVTSPSPTSSSSITSPSPTSSPIPNDPPSLLNPIGTILTNEGKPFQFRIPEETFFDPEDGLTSNLKLSLLDSSGNALPNSSWIQLQNNSLFLGLPLRSEIQSGRITDHVFILRAEDRFGTSAHDFVTIRIRPEVGVANLLVVFFEGDFESFNANLSAKIELASRLPTASGNLNQNEVYLREFRSGSIGVAYSNLLIRDLSCIEFFEWVRTVYVNGSYTPQFIEAMRPFSPLQSSGPRIEGPCSSTTVSVAPTVGLPPVIDPDPQSKLVLFLAVIVTMVIVAIIILLIAFLCFILYRRKRKERDYLDDRWQQRTFLNRRPVILATETDLPPRARRPVILPNESTRRWRIGEALPPHRPPPPRLEIENAEDESSSDEELVDFPFLAPPTSQPPPRRDPPKYRLPPDYFHTS